MIDRLINNPEMSVDPQWVLDQLEAHPTYILPALLLLKRNPEAVDDDTRRRLQTAVVLNCPDRTALADYIDITGGDWSEFYPPVEVAVPTTERTIDDFLETYGHVSTPEEDALLERLLFNPVPVDYFADTDTPFDPNDPLALPPELRQDDDTDEPEAPENEKIEEKAENAPQKVPQPKDDTLLMESLAKIFIKQHRYERAYEIISKLSLKNSEKSVYFADQLRFLQKLIINQRYKDQKENKNNK